MYEEQRQRQLNGGQAPNNSSQMQPLLPAAGRQDRANSERVRLDAEEEVERIEREQEESKKMNLPFCGRVYKRQMLVNLIIAVLFAVYVLLLTVT